MKKLFGMLLAIMIKKQEIYVVTAIIDRNKVKVCECYISYDVANERFCRLKETYGGTNVCIASRYILQ